MEVTQCLVPLCASECAAAQLKTGLLHDRAVSKTRHHLRLSAAPLSAILEYALSAESASG